MATKEFARQPVSHRAFHEARGRAGLSLLAFLALSLFLSVAGRVWILDKTWTAAWEDFKVDLVSLLATGAAFGLLYGFWVCIALHLQRNEAWEEIDRLTKRSLIARAKDALGGLIEDGEIFPESPDDSALDERMHEEWDWKVQHFANRVLRQGFGIQVSPIHTGMLGTIWIEGADEPDFSPYGYRMGIVKILRRWERSITADDLNETADSSLRDTRFVQPLSALVGKTPEVPL